MYHNNVPGIRMKGLTVRGQSWDPARSKDFEVLLHIQGFSALQNIITFMSRHIRNILVCRPGCFVGQRRSCNQERQLLHEPQTCEKLQQNVQKAGKNLICCWMSANFWLGQTMPGLLHTMTGSL